MLDFQTRLLIALVRAYRLLISPLLHAVFGAACRFHPSCSQYAIESLATHGAARGGWLTLKRIARCHPWNAGGLDPVPAPTSDSGKPKAGPTSRPS